MVHNKKFILWLSFAFVLGLTLGIKAISSGWLSARLPLELNDQAAILFFNKERGCECELVVYRGAEAQILAWTDEARAGIPIHTINVERRPDLARQYQVNRAPALILLDRDGQIVWRQDTGVSDEAPLDLETAGRYILSLKTELQ